MTFFAWALLACVVSFGVVVLAAVSIERRAQQAGPSSSDESSPV